MYILIVGGAPGTGKTSVSQVLSGWLGCESIGATRLLGMVGGLERDPSGRQTLVATDEGLRRASRVLEDAVRGGRCVVLDTVFPRDWFDLLSTHVPAVVLLRCRPDVLLERLSRRGWPRDKVLENVLAEAFGVVAETLLDVSYDVVEVDTTGLTPESAAERVLDALERWDTGIRIDWLFHPDIGRRVVEWSLRLDSDKYRLGI